MEPARFDYGHAVRVVRNIRNDGTFPGERTGALLVRRGTVGYVRNVGTFLQDQVIYEVHFLEADRLVGCRQEELIDAAERWVPSRFESREWVTSRLKLAVNGVVVAQPGDLAQILKVVRDERGVFYQVRFPGRTLQVPESALEPASDPPQEASG